MKMQALEEMCEFDELLKVFLKNFLLCLLYIFHSGLIIFLSRPSAVFQR